MTDFQDAHPPIRSISLPSRLQPESIQVISDLKKLRSCPYSCTTEAIRAKMTSLVELLVRVQEILSSPLTQQALGKHRSGNLMEEALEGSITVIDMCGQARDMLSAMREQVLEVQSSLRRSRGGVNFSCLEAQVRRFVCFRKKAKREAAKHMKELKKVVDENCSTSSLEVESSHLEIVIRVLNDVNNISGVVLKTLFELLSATKTCMKSSSGGWSLVSRLMLSSTEKKRSPCQQKAELTEVESVDSDLCSILRSKKGAVDLKTIQKRLEGLDCCIRGFEEGLESLFKFMIQYRVSLLNVLTS